MSSKWTSEDVQLCLDEMTKLVGVLRTTERYSDVTKPAVIWPRETLGSNSTEVKSTQSSKKSSPQSSVESTPLETAVVPPADVTSANLISQILEFEIGNNRSESDFLGPFLQVIVDPSLSGFVTAAALAAVLRIVQDGSALVFLNNTAVVGLVVDAVARTRFMETDRDHDEIVLSRIISLMEFVLIKSTVIEKGRIALGLQCIQTIWIQDTHSAALKDAARHAVFRILLHVLRLSDGCDGYASTLMDNVCLNIELLSKQPPNAFDFDKLSFFIEVLSSVSRIAPPRSHWSQDIVPFQLTHALHHLIPAGPAALLIDNSGSGLLARNMMGLPVVSSLLSIGNDLVKHHLSKPSHASPLVLEALISSMYLRGMCPVIETGSDLKGYGETALSLLTTKKNVSAALAPNGYINLVQSAAITQQLSPHTQQLQASLLESLSKLIRDDNHQSQIIATLWESFDCVWHRHTLVSDLVDSVVNTALSNRVIALIPPGEEKADSSQDRIQRALTAFHALATSPESIIDPEALIPSYVECLTMGVLKDMLVSLHHSLHSSKKSGSEDQTPTQFLIRLSSRECAKQIKAKPKKTAEIITQFLAEYERHVKAPCTSPAGAIAWILRLVPSLDFDSVGEFFGQPGETSNLALSAFIKSLNLKSMDPEEALRACLQSFRLPGEAQQIDRIIKEIAYEFYNSHSDLSVIGNYFASADAAYTFLFSVIMLNTDQHNPQVKKRMELRDFTRNNRKINEGTDIPEEVQTRVFNSIRASQIVTPKSASFFCAPLKGRWKDLWYLHETNYIPNHIRTGAKHSVHRLIAAKGYEMLLAAAYVMARDPKRYTDAMEVIAALAELSLSSSWSGSVDPIVKSIGFDAITILRRYAIKSFATIISNIVPTNRSFDCLSALLKLDVSADCLVEAVSAMLCYWAPYEMLLKDVSLIPVSWDEVLQVPLIDVGSVSPQTGGGAITSLIRGLFYDGPTEDQNMQPNQVPAPQVEEATETSVRRSSSLTSTVAAAGLVGSGDWRKEVLRTSFADSSPNAPPAWQISALKSVGIGKYLDSLTGGDGTKSSAIVLSMLDQIAASLSRANSEGYWGKELIRSTPWSLLLAARLLALSKSADLIASSPARDAVLAILKNFRSGQLNDYRGLKVTVFVAFALVTIFAQNDPESNIVDPAWILPILDEITSLAQDNAAVACIAPAVCLSIQMMLTEAPETWLGKVGAPVWRECVKLAAALCPKQKANDVAKRICQETVLMLLLDRHVLSSFVAAANGANDVADCVVSYEQILQVSLLQKTVSKSLADFACKLAGLGTEGAGLAWTAVTARITARVTAVAKQKKPTGPELSDSVELLRICLGDPRVYQILSPSQAGSTVERCASALSAVVSANTPGGALQAALCVFARFFLSCLDMLQRHPQFDHLWLMSLRVVLLFIKRGHDDPGMEQLAEITTETLRNALQVLVATELLQLPPVEGREDAPVVWWKVTWEIVETFCPGMWAELKGGDQKTDGVDPDQGVEESVESEQAQESAELGSAESDERIDSSGVDSSGESDERIDSSGVDSGESEERIDSSSLRASEAVDEESRVI